MNKDIENLKLAIQKKELGVERYSDQIKALSDPKPTHCLRVFYIMRYATRQN